MPQLPAIRAPKNALLNFAPLSNAIGEFGQVQRQREQNEYARGIDQEKLGMQREEHALRVKSHEQRNQRHRVQQIAGVAQRIKAIADPAQRDKIWNAYAAREPELFSSLPEDVRDSVRGPDFLMAEAVGYVDPMKRKLDEANLSRINAQTNKANRSAQESAATFGRSGMVFNSPDGKQYTIQFGSDGSRRILPIEGGLTRERGIKTVDTGTETQIIDAGTAAPIRSIDKNIVGEAKLKAEGKRQGDIVANVRKARGTMFSLEQQWSTVDRAIDDAVSNIGVGTTGLIGTGSALLPGTPAYDLARTIDTIKSNIGFDKLQDMRDNSPTGGALGQVSEFENRLLQSVRNSLEQGQSGEQLKANMLQVKSDLIALQQERRHAYQLDYGSFGDEATPQAPAPQAESGQPGAGWSIKRVQ